MKKLLYDMSKIGKPHSKADPNCECCHGRGWAIFTRANAGEYPQYEGYLTVQRCDNCYVFSNDMVAARLAIKAGIPCDTHYPCVLTKQSKGITKYKTWAQKA